jgi:hypothetical protein
VASRPNSQSSSLWDELVPRSAPAAGQTASSGRLTIHALQYVPPVVTLLPWKAHHSFLGTISRRDASGSDRGYRVLKNESRVIVNLLLAGQDQAARQRIIAGRQRLQPLEDDLASALAELQQIEASIGYASPQDDR